MPESKQSVNRKLYLGLGIIILIGLIIWAAVSHQQASQPAAPPSALSQDPLTAPRASHRLSLGPTQTVHPQAISLPRGQLQAADWFLPLSPSSSVAYVLHDGQSRWLVAGTRRSFPSMPTDPIGTLAVTTDGRAMAWMTTTGVDDVTWPSKTPKFIAKATAPSFQSGHELSYILKDGVFWRIVMGSHHYTLAGLGQIFSHPFIDGGVAYDDHGHLGYVLVAHDTRHLVASVDAAHWSTPLNAGSLSDGGMYFLLAQHTPIPSYLLVVDQRGWIGYYAWQSPTIPEIGSVHGVLALTYLEPNGQLVILKGHQLVPLNVYPNLFSLGPMGLVWQSANGHFRQLSELP